MFTMHTNCCLSFLLVRKAAHCVWKQNRWDWLVASMSSHFMEVRPSVFVKLRKAISTSKSVFVCRLWKVMERLANMHATRILKLEYSKFNLLSLFTSVLDFKYNVQNLVVSKYCELLLKHILLHSQKQQVTHYWTSYDKPTAFFSLEHLQSW